jgi:hypothetical protein
MTNTATIFHPIAYPESRMVSQEQLTIWALDAIANEDTDIQASEEELRADFDLVRQVLDDSGYATIVSRPRAAGYDERGLDEDFN